MSWNPIGDAPANPYEIVEASSNYTIQSGELVFAESGVELTFPEPEPDDAIGVASVDGKSIELVPQSGEIESESERQYNDTEVSYFVSDGTDWYAVSNRELLNVIPDSVVHRLKLGEGTGTTTTDSVGDRDGDIIDLNWTSNNWQEGHALERDEADNADGALWVDWGYLFDKAETGLTLAMVFKTTEEGRLAGRQDNGEDQDARFGIGDLGRGGSSNKFNVTFDDHSGGEAVIESNTSVNDGEKHSVVIGLEGDNPSDWVLFIDGESDKRIVSDNLNITWQTFSSEIPFLAYDDEGTKSSPNLFSTIDNTMDDILIADEKWDEDDALSYHKNQPWT